MGSFIKVATPPLVDPYGVPIIFTTGLADSRLFGSSHILFTCYLDVPVSDNEWKMQRQIAAKVAMERVNVPAGIRMAIATAGMDMAREKAASIFQFAA